MIVAEELLYQEWKCFEHLTLHTRDGNHITLPKLERPSSECRQLEENSNLTLHLQVSLVVQISHSMEMVEAKNLNLSVA